MTGQVDRIWAIGGAIAAAVLVAVGWLVLISPQNAAAAGLREQKAAVEGQVTILEKRIAELREQNVNKASYQADLVKDRQALPLWAMQAELLRELQSADYATKVAASVAVGAPSQVMVAGSPVYAMAISLSAVGTTEQLVEFIRQLQVVQPRAVLIDSASLTGDLRSGEVTLTLSLKAFVSPPPGSVPPAPATPGAAVPGQ